MLRVKPVACKLGNADGAEIAEAALVLPLVFMLLLGIVWFGRAYNIYSTIQQAAQQGAITAARDSCSTCGNNASGAVTTVITAVMQASNLDPNQIKLSPNPPACAPGLACIACPAPPFPAGGCPAPTSSNIYVCQNVQLNPAASQPIQCGSVVTFQYPFQFTFPGTSLNMSQIILTAQAQSRMED